MRVVDAVAEWFEAAGFRHYFGYAGGAIWPFLDALIDHPELEGIQAKHESHAVHMADVYYRTTGRIAPVLVSKGPGLLNTVGAVASAMHDPSAVMVFAGAGSTHLMGKGGMQELYYKGFEDAISVFRPITKGSWILWRPDTVIDVLNQAYKTAVTGRPGPVFIQLPFDVQLAAVEGTPEPPASRVPASRPRADSASIRRTADLLRGAQRPVIVAGGGCKQSAGAPGLIATLAETTRTPVATTLTAKGIFPESHELSVATVGRSGTDAAAATTRNADVVLALGARFSDNHTSNWRKNLIYDIPRTKVVQVNVDYDELGRNYPIEVGVAADAGSFVEDLIAELGGSVDAAAHDGWLAKIEGWKQAWNQKALEVISAQTSPIHPGRLCYEVGEAIAEAGGRVFIDVGDVIQYAEPYMRVDRPDAWHINSGMAEMGWASSGVLGAVAAHPGDPAVALTGDGAFNMVSAILATAVEHQLPAVWVILNNHELGIERKGSDTAYHRVHPWTRFVRKDTGEPYNPDYTKLAEANGASGVRVEKADEFAPALARALQSGEPWVIDVAIDQSIPTFFTEGVDRAYPAVWEESYPQYSSLTVPHRQA
ncbi:MAG: thiamine pyrophosphate-binding protein [Streptosporangiaceae bacterium]